jgi:hypothetical protein
MKSSGAYQTRTHGTVHIAYISYDKGWDLTHAVKPIKNDRTLPKKYLDRTPGLVSD